MRIPATRLIAVLACVAAAATLHADWSGAAATATIDEADLGKVVLNTDGSAAIRSTINSTSARVRFPVVKTPTLQVRDPRPDEVGSLVFVMRARDNGAGARVIATLKRVTLGYFLEGPQTEVAATIDSDAFAPSDGWMTAWANSRTRYSSSCCWIRNPQTGTREELNFFDSAYFVEVQLIKNNAEGNPGVMGVGIIRDQP